MIVIFLNMIHQHFDQQLPSIPFSLKRDNRMRLALNGTLQPRTRAGGSQVTKRLWQRLVNSLGFNLKFPR